MRPTSARSVQELLSIKQAAELCNCTVSELADALRVGQLQIHSIGGPVFFRHPENMPIYLSDDAYVTRFAVEEYRETHVGLGKLTCRKSRSERLDEIGALANEPAHIRRKVTRDVLAIFEGAAHDSPEDRYLAGARDVLRQLCHRERVWHF